jgi:hypothetical protein
MTIYIYKYVQVDTWYNFIKILYFNSYNQICIRIDN